MINSLIYRVKSFFPNFFAWEPVIDPISLNIYENPENIEDIPNVIRKFIYIAQNDPPVPCNPEINVRKYYTYGEMGSNFPKTRGKET